MAAVATAKSANLRCRVQYVLVAAIACIWASILSAEPAPHQCDDPLIRVTIADPDAAEKVCAIAANAYERFAALGRRHSRKISIVVTEDLDVAPGHCVALYCFETGTLQVLSDVCLADAPGRLSPFPRIPAMIMFESLIIQELTHAYLSQSSDGRAVSRLGHEYLAYALQLDALPASERERIIEESGAKGPVVMGEFSEAPLSFSPIRFAAVAWMHFQDQPDPAAAVADILAGRTLFQSLRE